MAKKASHKKSNNALLTWVFIVLFALIIFAVAIVLILNTQSNPNTNSNFFVSDSHKYVIASDSSYNTASDSPIISYDVYYHNDNTITSHQAYYEFSSEEAAKAALPYYKSLQDADINSVEQSGKYIVLTANQSQFKDLTLDDIKQ